MAHTCLSIHPLVHFLTITNNAAMNICTQLFATRTAAISMQDLTPSLGWELRRSTEKYVLFTAVSPVSIPATNIHLMRRRQAEALTLQPQVTGEWASATRTRESPLCLLASPWGPTGTPASVLFPSPRLSSSPFTNPAQFTSNPTTSPKCLFTPVRPTPSWPWRPAPAP